MPTLHVGDIDLHYDLTDYTDPWRPAQTVLLHHGFARNLRFWRPWVPLLARDFRVLRFDARGCGLSSVPPRGTPYTLDAMVADAVGLLDALDIDQVHWAGEAAGGIVGVATALAHPERVTSLTLVNTPFRLPQVSNDLFDVDEIEQHGLGFWARKSIVNRIDLDKVAPEWVEWQAEEIDRMVPHVAIAQHEMIAAGNLLPRLPDLRRPVLILAGVNSRIASRDAMELMCSTIPGARWVPFDGYGQGIAFSAPERCVAELRAFIGSLPSHGVR